MNKLLQLILVVLIMSITAFANEFNDAINAVFGEATNYFTFQGTFDSGSNIITLSRVTRNRTQYGNGEAFPLIIPGSKTVTSSGTNITYTIKLYDDQNSNSDNSIFRFTNIDYPVTLTLSNITAPRNCKGMFRNSSGLIEADLSGFDTSNVTDMRYMFAECSSLTKLNLFGFDTSEVTNMSNLFQNCSSLKELDLSGFKTSNVTHMGHLFAGCGSLTKLNLSGDFDTSKAKFIDYMFADCSSLTELDLSNFRTSNAEWIQGMFENCSSLTELDLSNFDTSKAVYMEYMFGRCSSLTELDLSKFDTSNVTSMSSMFEKCSSLTKLDLSSFNTNNVTNMFQMFQYCSSLTKLDISNFDTGKVTEVGRMFKACTGLRALKVSSDFPKNASASMGYMFSERTKDYGKIIIRSPDGNFSQRFVDHVQESTFKGTPYEVDYKDIVTFSHIPLNLSFKVESGGVLIFARNANRNSNIFFDNETGITLENNSTVKNATTVRCPTNEGEKAYFELADGATSAAIKNIFAVQHDNDFDGTENVYRIKQRGKITGNYACITEDGTETTEISIENDSEIYLESLAELTENDTVVFAIHDGESLEQNTVVIKNEEDGPAEIVANISNNVDKDGYAATDVTFQGNLKFSGNQSGFVNGKATASGADIEFVGDKSMFQVPLELKDNSKVKISESIDHGLDIDVEKGSQLEIKKNVTLSGGVFKFGC